MANSFPELITAGLDLDKIKIITKPAFDEYDLNDDGLDWDEFLHMSIK